MGSEGELVQSQRSVDLLQKLETAQSACNAAESARTVAETRALRAETWAHLWEDEAHALSETLRLSNEALHLSEVARHSCEEERDELLQRVSCCVCMERERAVLLLPCTHFVLCTACAFQLQRCPICR